MLSFVIPTRDNDSTIKDLFQQISNQCDQIRQEFEVIIIDYGRRNDSWLKVRDLSEKYPHNIRAIQLQNHASKESACRIGFHLAIGDVIFTMSACLKDDPVAIPRFLKELKKGNDVVIGHRYVNKKKLSRFSPMKLLNQAVAVFSGVDLNKYNSNFVCYRSDVIRAMTELSHRSIHKKFPLSASIDGYKVGVVSLKGRFGTTYNRYNLLEYSTLNFLNNHPEKPQRFVFSVACALFSAGMVFVILGQSGSTDNGFMTLIGSGLIFNVIPLAVLGIVMEMQVAMLSNGQGIEALSHNLIAYDTAMKIDLSITNSQNNKISQGETKVSHQKVD